MESDMDQFETLALDAAQSVECEIIHMEGCGERLFLYDPESGEFMVDGNGVDSLEEIIGFCEVVARIKGKKLDGVTRSFLN
jgi:hypothetical protein